MSTPSATDLRRDIIRTRERLNAAERMATRASNLRHDLSGVVEGQRRSAPHTRDERAVTEALGTFLDPEISDGGFGDEIEELLNEYRGIDDDDALRDSLDRPLREAFAFLRGEYVNDDGTRRTAFEAFRRTTTIENDDLREFVDRLEAYVEGTAFVDRGDVDHRGRLRSAFEGAMSAAAPTPERLLSFVELTVEAARTYRADLRDRLNTIVEEDGTEKPGLVQRFLDVAESEATDPASFLDAHPVALLPVRVETRFVDDSVPLLNESPDRDPHLRLRVFPDDIHVDTHEEELTSEEERLGRFFWAKLWICSHPDPASAMGQAVGASGRTDDLGRKETRRHLETALDTGEFDAFSELYDSVKRRSWTQLVDRLGRERAAWVVHRMTPEEIGDELLRGWTQADVAADGGDNERRPHGGKDDGGKQGPYGPSGPRASPDSDSGDEGARTAPFERGPSDDPNANVPALSFPTVANRPESWTKQPRAKLMPDRWVVYGWTARRADGDEGNEDDGEYDPQVPDWARERVESDLQFEADVSEYRGDGFEPTEDGEPTVSDEYRSDGGAVGPDLIKRGPAIREPLPMGPDPETDDDHSEPPTEATDAAAPEGLKWTVDFEAAERVGMALRVDAADLDVPLDDDEDVTDITFDRLVVVGVKSTMSARQSTTGLRALFEAHHYTDGLEFLEEGTQTNNAEEDSGYTATDDPEESVGVECGPPLTEFGDDARPGLDETVPTDGDLLARTLGVAAPDDDPHEHVFAHVEGADRVGAAAQHHANAALWDGTIGYYLRNVILSNRWTGEGSIWADADGAGPYDTAAAMGSFFQVPEDALGGALLWEDRLRRHFVRHVRAGGPLPTIRTGTQPYGILPVTDVDGLERDDVVDLVRTLRTPFERAAESVDSISDAALGSDRVRETVRSILRRTAHGDAYQSTQLWNTDAGSAGWRRSLAETLETIGLTGLDSGEPSLDPRLGWLQPIGTERGDPGMRGTTDGYATNVGVGGADDHAAAPSQLVGHTDDRFLALLSAVDFEDLRTMGFDPDLDGLSVDLETLPDALAPDTPAFGFTDEELLFHALTHASYDQWEDAATLGGIGWSGSRNHNRDAVARDLAPPHAELYYLFWDLYDEYGDPGTLHTLLRALSRFSLLETYVSDRIRMPVVYGELPALNQSSGVGGPSFDVGTPGERSVWEWLRAERPDTNVEWVDYIDIDDEFRVHDVRASLSALATLDPETLRRCLTGTLGLASHRFDAWWTSLSTRRLVENRSTGTDLRVGGIVSEFTHETGTDEDGTSYDVYDQSSWGDTGEAATSAYTDETVTYVGGYGLVEDLSADTEGAGSDETTEFTQAPTVQHATTAALLRGAHKALDEPELAVNFSAGRVRKGRWVLRGLEHGQRLGALLGYRFERHLKEHGSGTEVAHLAAYRTAFPAVAGTLDHDGDGAPPDDDAEFDVTDGYQLYHAWRKAESEAAFFDDHDVPRGPTVEAAISAVEETVDALRDLLLAEDIHQLGMGNFDRAGWSVDSLAAGEGVPELDVLRTPRDGVDVSHRMATLFGDPSSASAPDPWQVSGVTVDPDSLPTPPDAAAEPAAARRAITAATALPDDGGPDPDGDSPHPRREAERNLNAWTGEFLPAPDDAGCEAAFQWTRERSFSTGSFTTPTEETTVSVRDIGFEPDVLLFSASTAVAETQQTVTDDGDVGWFHGAAARTHDEVREAAAGVAVAPDGTTAEATTNDRAVSMVRLSDDGSVEETTATLNRTVDGGFDLEFSTVESATPVAVQYLAIETGATGSVDVGHFATTGTADTHEEPLAVEADHAVLALGATGAPGFSHGHAVDTDQGIQEASVSVAATPGGDATVAARADRAVHLPYGGGEATTAGVTDMGSTLDINFAAASDATFRDDGAACVYVAFQTPGEVERPAIGVLEEGHNDCGFEPSAVSLVGASGIARGDLDTTDGRATGGTSVAAAGAVGLSHGFARGRGHQRTVTQTVHPDDSSHAGFAGTGEVLRFLDTNASGTVTGRTRCTLTGTDDTGFSVSFSEGSASDGLALYVAWPADPGTLAHEEPTDVTVDDLDLTPIDLLYHSQQHSDAGESQLEQRMAYDLVRTRGTLDPAFPIPDDAAVELRFTETPEGVSFSVAELLEVLRSVRELAFDGRSVDADDLVHPAEAQGSGYTEPSQGVATSTVGDLRDRALSGARALRSVRETVENRRAALTATDADGDTLTERMSDLRAAVETYDTEVPTAAVDRATADLDATDVGDAVDDPAVAELGAHLPGSRTIDATAVDDVGDLLLWELETLGRFVPAGPTEEPPTPNGTTLRALTDRTVAGTADVPSRAEVDLHVWRGSPGSAFVAETQTVPTDTRGGFEATLDCSDATPGELVTVVGTFRRDLPDPTSEADLGIVRLSSLLDEGEYDGSDPAVRFAAVRNVDDDGGDERAVLDVHEVADSGDTLALRLVVSDPDATLRSNGRSVIVEAVGDADRVETGFEIGGIESLDPPEATEWLILAEGSPRELPIEDILDGRADPRERLGPGDAVRELADDITERLASREDSADQTDGPQPGDVVYTASIRVTEADAAVVAEVDPGTNGTATATVETATSLEEGVSITVEATRADGTTVDTVSTETESGGTVSVALSVGGLAPRRAFTVTGTANGETAIELSGCTVGPDDRRSPTDVLADLTVLPRLLWLDGEIDPIDPTADGTPGASLRAALDAVDWDRIDDELAAMKAFRSTLVGADGVENVALTDRVVAAVEAVTASADGDRKPVEGFDPIVLHTNLDRLVEPLASVGVTDAYSVVGTVTDRTSLRYWETPKSSLGRVQGALEHAVENPAVLLGEQVGIDESFAPAFKSYVDGHADITEDMALSFSHYLGEALAAPELILPELTSDIDDPHEFFRHLGALVYEPSTFASDATPSTFESQFGSFVDAIPELDGLANLLTPSPAFPSFGSESGRTTVRATLDGASVSLPGTVVADAEADELELVVENATGGDRTVELGIAGETNRLVVAGDEVATVGAGGTRRVELALTRPETGAATATLTVTDRDAATSATADVTVPDRPAPSSVDNRDPTSEFWLLCHAFDTAVLGGYVSSVTSGGRGGLPAPADARSDYVGRFDRWVGVAADAASGARSRVGTALDAGDVAGESAREGTPSPEPLAIGAFDDALRVGMLEPLRRALLRASYLGIYGATPQSAAGGKPADVDDLVAQAAAVVERVDGRLSDVADALSGVDDSATTDELAAVARAATEAVFDDAFTVFPPFDPHNPGELSATFANDTLVPDDDPLAAESFLGRISRVRDRPRALREAYSYGEVVTGRPMLDLTIGQVPHRPGDDWIGLSNVALRTQRQSLVAQLETGAAREGIAGGPVAGVFVDDWNETVPERDQTAGVAVNYDGPDSTAPNAVLLATPPADQWSWAVEDVRRMVVDAAETMKVRMIGPSDARAELGELLPAVWLPDVDTSDPPGPSVDLSLLDHDGWETYRQDIAAYWLLQADHLLALTEISYATFASGSVPILDTGGADDGGGDR